MSVMSDILEIEERMGRHVLDDVSEKTKGRHTITEIEMRDDLGLQSDPPRRNRLTCACGIQLRRKTSLELSAAFSRHAGVIPEEELE